MIYHRPVNSLLTVCLTPGDNPSKNLPAYQPSGYFYIPRADLSIDHGSAPSIFGHVGAIDLLPFEGKTSELSEIMLNEPG
jgi:hypothetical protein